MPPIQPSLVYNQRAINAWQLDIDLRLPNQIKFEQSILNKLLDEQKDVEGDLSIEQGEIERLEKKLSLRRKQIASTNNLTNTNPGDEKKLDRLMKRDKEIEKLASDLSMVRQKVQDDTKKLEVLATKVSDKEATITKLQESKIYLQQTQIPLAEHFLTQLKCAPDKLFREKLNEVFETLENFNQTVVDQDDNLLLCLHSLENKKNLLLSHPIYFADANQSENIFAPLREYKDRRHRPIEQNKLHFHEIWQRRYAELNGFLGDLLYQYQYQNPEPNPDFIALLHDLLNSLHIDDPNKLTFYPQSNEEPYNDLPNEMATGVSTFQQFQSLKKDYPQILTTQPKNLPQLNQQAYEKAFSNLQSFASQGATERHQRAKHFAEILDADLKKHTKPEDQQRLQKTYCKSLTQAHSLFTAVDQNKWDKKTDQIFSEFSSSANQMQGAPSKPKRIVGAILGVVGTILSATLLAASIGAAIATFGGTSFLSGYGIVLSASLFAKSMAALTAAAVVGTTAGGWSLFHHGKQRGISRAIEEEAEFIARNKPVRV